MAVVLEIASASSVAAALHQMAKGMLVRRMYFTTLRRSDRGSVGGWSKSVWILLLVDVPYWPEGADVDACADTVAGG